jgi:hypothetical protein
MDVMAHTNALNEFRRDRDKAMAADLLNQVTKMNGNVTRNRSVLKRRIDFLERKMEEAESRLDNLQPSTFAVPSPSTVPSITRNRKIEEILAQYYPVAEEQPDLPCGLLSFSPSARPPTPLIMMNKCSETTR